MNKYVPEYNELLEYGDPAPVPLQNLEKNIQKSGSNIKMKRKWEKEITSYGRKSPKFRIDEIHFRADDKNLRRKRINLLRQ